MRVIRRNQMSDPFAPLRDAARLLSAFPHPWMFAGGWAIDLFLGGDTRRHKDVDIAIFREHQLDLQRCLHGWQIFVPGSRKLEPWQQGEYLQLPAHNIWAYGPGQSGAGDVEVQPDLEVLFNERDSTNWVYRRNPLITRPLTLACLTAPSGMPYLAPEIVLLYKAKGTRDSDHEDFEAVLGWLRDEQRLWLREALEVDRPEHEWLGHL